MGLTVDVVLAERAGRPVLFAGRTPDGQRWLVAEGREGVGEGRWLCAPASDLAIRCVASGRAQAADVLRHSATGTVSDISFGGEGTFSECIRLCASLADEELPG